MGIAGPERRSNGGAPTPDAGRVAALGAAITDDAQAHAAFAEPAYASLSSLNDRTLAETRTSDLGECSTLLAHIRDRVTAFDLHQLEPRRGLAGLFDSRKARLIRFREDYQSTLRGLVQATTDLADRATAIGRKGTALDTLWADLRAAVIEIDAHLAAAAHWLAARPAPDETATADTPHALSQRSDAIAAARAIAIARLPLVRAAQNADQAAPDRLAAVAQAFEVWQEDWTDALGLKGRRPRTVRPEQGRLTRARDTLLAAIASAEHAINDAQTRRAEIEGRTSRPAQKASDPV